MGPASIITTLDLYRRQSVRGFRPYYKITDMNTARADDVTPDPEGDVVLAAQPGQRVQNPRISGA